MPLKVTFGCGKAAGGREGFQRLPSKIKVKPFHVGKKLFMIAADRGQIACPERTTNLFALAFYKCIIVSLLKTAETWANLFPV